MSSIFLPIDVQDRWSEYNRKVTSEIECAVEDIRNYMQVMWVIMNKGSACRSKPFSADHDSLVNVFYEHTKWNPLTVAPSEEDLVIGKSKMSIGSNPVASASLKEMSVDTIYLAGFMAMQCVFDSGRYLVGEGFNVVFLEDLSADLHDNINEGYETEYTNAGIKVSSYERLKARGAAFC